MKFCKCGKKLSKDIYIQCQNCFLATRKGKNHPSFKKGIYSKYIKHYCIDCHTELFDGRSERCKSCAQKGNLNPINRPENKERFSKLISKIHKGKIISKEMKKKLSKANSGKGNPMFGKVTHSKSAYYKNIWMRSNWEIAYAKYLDKNSIKWQYESKTFDLGNTTYTPDFYLPVQDLYIEIKGYWRADAKKKFRLFKKLYKNINLLVLTEIHLKSLKLIK